MQINRIEDSMVFEIARGVADGMCGCKIAEKLGTSANTVSKIRKIVVIITANCPHLLQEEDLLTVLKIHRNVPYTAKLDEIRAKYVEMGGSPLPESSAVKQSSEFDSLIERLAREEVAKLVRERLG